ncbi:MAG: hypothetical protein ACO1NO_08195 [Burkholderiaceae bacterium]
MKLPIEKGLYLRPDLFGSAMKNITFISIASLLSATTTLNARPVSTSAGTSGQAQESGPLPEHKPGTVQSALVRGDSQSGSTSDREASRTWSGIGSTGGDTGTGTRSGMAQDPPSTGAGAGKDKAGREHIQKNGGALSSVIARPLENQHALSYPICSMRSVSDLTHAFGLINLNSNFGKGDSVTKVL